MSFWNSMLSAKRVCIFMKRFPVILAEKISQVSFHHQNVEPVVFGVIL